MKLILHGIRAGIFSGLLLTLWSVINISNNMAAADDWTGVLYTATAFGLLGLPQLIYGLALGTVITIWRNVLIPPKSESVLTYYASPARDQKLAASILTAEAALGFMALSVGISHLLVTSKFVRINFQVIGLIGITAVLAVGIAAIAPLFYNVFMRALRLIPGKNTRQIPVLTTSLLAIHAIMIVIGIIGGYVYASSLNVWSVQLITMGISALILTPIFYVLSTKIRIKRIAWTWGIPLAGSVAIIICFLGASIWAVANQDMRRATFRDSHLVAATAQRIISIPTEDDNIFAFSGDDCDASHDDNCEPKTQIIPLTSIEHPARRTVSRAIDAGNTAQINRFEEIPEPPKNLVLILIDTLRQDHLGYAGYDRDTSPNIDKIAAESTVFLDSYAPSPHTPRSIPPLFFSRYSSRMRWDAPRINYPRVRPENLSLFEVLQDNGYKNIAMTSHFYFSERQGIRQGFDVWDNEGAGTIAESNDDIAAPRTWEKLKPIIEQLGHEKRTKGDDAQPFSLFVHFFEPHARWIGHKEFDFGRGDTTRERHINNYDSEIAFTDSYVGKVVDKLREEGLYDDVVFVITSDHGEAFDEHGYFFHGQTLYNPVVKVPLIIRVPGWFDRRVEGPVSLIDVAPSLLDLWSIPVPDQFEGHSLIETMLGRSAPPRRPVFSELLPYTSWKEHHRAIVYGDEKLIKNFTLGITEYYNLANDQGEQQNLVNQQPERAKKLEQMLQDFIDQ